MEEPIEEVYFNWLYSKVASVEFPTPSLTYWTLLRDLHSVEFVWLVQGDDNRAADGLELRKEFLRASQMEQDRSWLGIPCSVLEMLIAFTRRAEFETEISAREWFWIFLDHINLSEMSDSRSNVSERVYEALDKLIWRTYLRDGNDGGLFPLHFAEHDQTKVEIWYQFCAWLVDQERL